MPDFDHAPKAEFYFQTVSTPAIFRLLLNSSHSPLLILPAILPAIRPCQCRDMVTLGPLPFLGQE